METVISNSACACLNNSDNDEDEDLENNGVDNLWNILDKINTVRGMLLLTYFGFKKVVSFLMVIHS